MDAITETDLGQQADITISAAAATEYKIPVADNTAAQATVQIEALKGTHITMSATSATSNSYVYALAIFKKLGITSGGDAQLAM